MGKAVLRIQIVGAEEISLPRSGTSYSIEMVGRNIGFH